MASSGLINILRRRLNRNNRSGSSKTFDVADFIMKHRLNLDHSTQVLADIPDTTVKPLKWEELQQQSDKERAEWAKMEAAQVKQQQKEAKELAKQKEEG